MKPGSGKPTRYMRKNRMLKPQNIDYSKTVFVSIEKELWKAAKQLAIRQERPVRHVVADGLRLILKQDQAEVDPVQSWHQEAEQPPSHDKYSSLIEGGLAERPGPAK